MKDLNRIKVVLVEKKERRSGLQRNLEKIRLQSANGALMCHNLTCTR